MNPSNDRTPRSVPLGGLGTGVVEIGSDGRFRNLTLNNNRNAKNRIPAAPHSFLALRAKGAGQTYLRRLQTAGGGPEVPHILPPGGLIFRGNYPQADFLLNDPEAPLEVRWSAFSPVIPYDFDASALPLVFFAIQVTNTSSAQLEVSALLNWQNTCGQSALNHPDALAPAGTEVVITDAEWDRMTHRREGDNERRLSASSGRVETSNHRTFAAGEVPINALVFGDSRAVDSNEDGQYCIVSPWSNEYSTTLALWDPEDGASADRFWRNFERDGCLDSHGGEAAPRAGALCNRFSLAPGQSKGVEYVLSWYCPRYVGAGPDEGNYYANNFDDARAIARVGLDNRKYFHAAVSAWQKRLAAPGVPLDFARGLMASLEVLSTNSIHTREGDFGLFQSLADPRVNPLRDRWFWSMGLLLLFPRLELETLERLSARAVDEESRKLRVSEGIEGFAGGEFVGSSALQVEVCAVFVTLACRNYLMGGNRPAFTQVAPQLQGLMAAQLALDKDLDGFPDIQDEAPGLDGHFAAGLNAITAGLWMVALRAYERLARQQRYSEAELYQKAFERASRSFDRYFWDREHGYYTLYPSTSLDLVPENLLSTACHIGQLYPVWVAEVLQLDGVFPRRRVARMLETIEARNIQNGAILLLGAGAAGVVPPLSAAAPFYALAPYLCLKAKREPETPVYALLSRCAPGILSEAAGGAVECATGRCLTQLALWHLVAPLPAASLNVSERRIELRPNPDLREAPQRHMLCTPNGFGDVAIAVHSRTPFRCEVTFSMDIPQEITSIAITLAASLEGVKSRLVVADEPVAVETSLEAREDSEVCIVIRPRHHLSTPAFSLYLEERETAADPAASKKQWIPQWFRK